MKKLFAEASLAIFAASLTMLFAHWQKMSGTAVDMDGVDSLVAPYAKVLLPDARIGFKGNYDDMNTVVFCYQAEFFLTPRIVTKDTTACDTFISICAAADSGSCNNIPAGATTIMKSQSKKYKSVLYAKGG